MPSTLRLNRSVQEIAGHEEMVGQYESYKSFTMPHLYRVVEVRHRFGSGWGTVQPDDVWGPSWLQQSRCCSHGTPEQSPAACPRHPWPVPDLPSTAPAGHRHLQPQVQHRLPGR